MNNSKLILAILVSVLMVGSLQSQHLSIAQEPTSESFLDQRDGNSYRIIQIGDLHWFAENLKFETPGSVCYKKKKKFCETEGRLYGVDELSIACPPNWRVPNLKDWQEMKMRFEADSVVALLDTVHWDVADAHTNASGLSMRGSGYQFGKGLFLGYRNASSIWLDQFNNFDEYYHAHFYGGEGTYFKRSKHRTHEVLHAHPIENLSDRKFSIRCVCETN